MSVSRSRSRSLSIIAVVAAAAAVGAPAVAFAQQGGVTPVSIFGDATPSMKLVMIVLVLTMVVAVVVTVRKLMSGPSLTGGSAFLSALRLGAPLLGLLGAAYNGLNMIIGLANAGPQPIEVLAHGLAESAFLLLLGLALGVVAVICHWAVESRVDRMVLRA